MTTAPRLIVTRPEPDAGLWVGQLAQAGIDATALPLIEIAAVDGSNNNGTGAPAPRQGWQALEGYDACMFVSGHAVTHFFNKKPGFPQVGPAQSAIDCIALCSLANVAPQLRFMAPGPGTVAALRTAGVPAAQIDAPALDAAQFDSEALWQVIGRRDWQGRKVLVVRGQGGEGEGAKDAGTGRDWLARQWRQAGAQVDFLSVYQRRAPVPTPAQVELARTAAADGSVWLFSSSEAVANLAGLPGLQGLDWGRARAIATHPRIVQAVRAAGWGVVAESRPALQDIGRALASIELRHP